MSRNPSKLGWPRLRRRRDQHPGNDSAVGWIAETAVGGDHVSRETSPVELPGGTVTPDVAPETDTADVPAEPPADVSPDESTADVSRETTAPDVSRETFSDALPRPEQTRVLTISNQKGGVGKTTTTVNMAVSLAINGLKVVVIDLDPQGNASTGLDIDHPNGTPSTYDVIVDKSPLREVIQPVQTEGVPADSLWCIPATSDLAGAEVELASVVIGREFRLKQAIEEFVAERAAAGERIDFIIIDCPPSLGLLTVNALAAAGEVMIPIQCEYYALEGLGQLLETVNLIRDYLNPQLKISALLLTMYDARTKLSEQVAQEVRDHFGETVLTTIIPRSVKVSEAPSYRQSVITYDRQSRGAQSYLAAAREFATRKP